VRVWVARAEPGAQATAARLSALGHEPVVAPVLQVRLLDADLDLAGIAALAFTSANGVRAFAGRETSRRWPVFAVGEATAAAAREAGFTQVESAGGDVAALAALIEARRPGLVLHPAAVEVAGDLAPRGVSVRTVAVYETLAARPAIDLGDVDAVLVHSPRAARVVAEMAAGSELAAFALSPACAAPLLAAGVKVTVAAEPNETALLTLLRA
jgi:uroporphyrinogen-III synthase